MNVADRLETAAAERPDHPALILGNTRDTLDYRELDALASRVGAGLRELGAAEGERVALVLPNSVEHVAAWFAAMKVGALPVDVNYLLGDEEWSCILADADPAVLVTVDEHADRLAELIDSSRTAFVVIGSEREDAIDFDELGQGLEPASAIERGPDDPCLIAYTSGTTGVPKGVVHATGRIQHQLDELVRFTTAESTDTIACFLPLFPMHAFLCQVGLSVHLGATFLLMDRFDPEILTPASHEHPISAGTFVPAIVSALLALPAEGRPQFSPGSRFNAGGAALHPEMRQRFEREFDVSLLQGFGSTEVVAAVAMEQPDRRAPWGSAGSVWLTSEDKIRVVDDDGVEVGPGVVGEFVVHRSLALLEYWRDETATEEAFIDGEWYRMGDIGKIEDGFVYVLDRKKDMIIRGGFNIYCVELERVLNEQPEVAEAVVIGLPHERLGEVPIAFVVPAPGHEPSPELAAALSGIVRERLGKLKVPEEVRFVAGADLPRNAMGKVIKRELVASANA